MEIRRSSDKLIILGTASSRDVAPLDDKSFDVWTIGNYAVNCPEIADRATAVFELHRPGIWQGAVDKLNGIDRPIVMLEEYPQVLKSVRYPIEQITETFYDAAMGKVLYVTNSVAYMLMLGYVLGYEEFHMYGVHMEHSSEYGYQKPNCEYYLGYLIAKGKTVVMPDVAKIIRAPYLYGYDEPWQELAALRNDYKKYGDQIAKAQEQIEQLKADAYRLEGKRDYARMLAQAKGAL